MKTDRPLLNCIAYTIGWVASLTCALALLDGDLPEPNMYIRTAEVVAMFIGFFMLLYCSIRETRKFSEGRKLKLPVKITAVVVVIMLSLVALSVVITVAANPIPDKSRTTYYITNVWELQNMSLDLSGDYIISNDINASITSGWNGGAGFLGVGPSTVNKFTGSLDGQHHIISGFFQNSTGSPMGMFRYLSSSATISNVTIFGNVTGNNFVGMLAGDSEADIFNCHTEGYVYGFYHGSPTGGMIGNVGASCTIHNCSADVNVTGGNDVGGLIGYAATSSGKIYVTDCFAQGECNGDGLSHVAGFSGAAWNVNFKNCYATNKVSNYSLSGGFVSNDQGGNTYISCYYDTNTTGQSDTGSGTPKTTTEMKQQSTYTGWNFINTWWMEEDVDYPILRNVDYGDVPPMSDAGPNDVAFYGVAYTFNGSESHDINGGHITNYTWNFSYNGTWINLYNVTPTFTFYNLTTYNVTLNVTDNGGLYDLDWVTIIVWELHSPIRIDNNTCFNSTNGVRSGSGTSGDPYIIDNWYINGSGAGDCVFVGNTTSHYIIRNCSFCDASGYATTYYREAGVELFNTSNGIVTNCSIIDNTGYSIYAYDGTMSYVRNITVFDNFIEHNKTSGTCIYWQTRGGKISDNIIHTLNVLYGINIVSPSSMNFYTNITNNVIIDTSSSTSDIGIHTSSSVHHITIDNNTINDYSQAIGAGQLDWLTINNTRVSGSDVGIHLSGGAHHAIVTNCTINDSYRGIQTLDSNYYNISYNVITLKKYYSTLINSRGIYVFRGDEYEIYNNTISGFGHTETDNEPLKIYASDNTIVAYNLVDMEGYSITIQYCNNVTLTGNILTNMTSSTTGQVYLINSNLVYLSGNVITSSNLLNSVGINNTGTTNSTFTRNIISNQSSIGMTFNLSSKNNIIYHNNFINNTIQAHDEGYNNTWDNGYQTGGNYWSDYNGTDNYHGIYQDIPGGDNIGDTPYTTNPTDYYPLINPIATNNIPVADAGYDQIGFSGFRRLYGNESSDAGGYITNWTWWFVYNSTAHNLYGEKANFTFANVGVYNVLLNVTDNQSNTDSDWITINITQPSYFFDDGIYGPAWNISLAPNATILDTASGRKTIHKLSVANITFADNFDGEVEGTSPPVNWTSDPYAAPLKNEVNATHSNSSPYSNWIQPNPSGNSIQSNYHNIEYAGAGKVSCRAYVTTGYRYYLCGAGGSPGSRNLNAYYHSILAYFWLSNTNDVYCINGNTSVDTGHNYVTGWHLFEISYNFDNRTYDAWYDSIQVANNFNITCSWNTSINKLCSLWNGVAKTGFDVWIDDWGIELATEPQAIMFNSTVNTSHNNTVIKWTQKASLALNDYINISLDSFGKLTTLEIHSSKVVLNGQQFSISTYQDTWMDWIVILKDNNTHAYVAVDGILIGNTSVIYSGISDEIQISLVEVGGNSESELLIDKFVTYNYTSPVANAGPDQTHNEGVWFFDGSLSTGAIYNYTWNFTFNSTAITLYDVTPNFNFTRSGNFLVTLTVNDLLGVTDNDTMWMNITNQLPVANAGPDDWVLRGNYTFNGSATDNDGYITNYTWNFTYNSVMRYMYGTTPLFDFQIIGTYPVTFKVTDDEGAFGWDNMTLTVNNTLPIADAGSDQAGLKGVYLFDGSGSYDPDGTITNYTWNFTYNSTMRYMYGAFPHYNFYQHGNYLVTLNVTDNDSDYDEDTCWINITWLSPVAEAGPDQSGLRGTYNFDGTGSTDGDGWIVNYTWTFTYNATGQAIYGVTPSFYFFSNGNYQVTLNVTDNDGLYDTDTMWINITLAWPHAVARYTPVTDNKGIKLVDGKNSTDADHGIVNYTWNFTFNGTPYTYWTNQFYFNFSLPGSHVVTLNVTDIDGLYNTTTVTISIVYKHPVSVPGNDDSTLAWTDYQFNGSESYDEDGHIVNYTWNFTYDNVTYLLYDVTPEFHFGAANETVVVNLMVTDEDGLSGNGTFNLTIVNPITASTHLLVILLPLLIVLLVILFIYEYLRRETKRKSGQV